MRNLHAQVVPKDEGGRRRRRRAKPAGLQEWRCQQSRLALSDVLCVRAQAAC